MLPPEARNVLVCLRWGIGDVVMAMPSLDALREVLPQARITALAAPPADQLLEGGGAVDDVVSLRRWGLEHLWDAADRSARADMRKWLKKSRFDLLLDVGHAPHAVRAEVEALGLSWLQGDSGEGLRALGEGCSGTAAILRAVRSGWGLELDPDVAPALRLRPCDLAFAHALLADLGALEEPPVAMAPAASTPLKRWPVERFARAADELLDGGARSILLFAAPGDGAAIRVRSAMQRPGGATLVPPLHLLRTAALLRQCRALVCNDTGLMHIAAAVGTPTVGIFGPTAPASYRPVGAHVSAVATTVACPHRSTRSHDPSRCWGPQRCLLDREGCIEGVSGRDVLRALEPHLAPLERRPGSRGA